ncbi:hypothetical protein KGM_213392 [Danaus plexippus plexippus]|uniref:Uncharacterized protein n=1 Tax=Danaus plexippus plexippus TaxID=278856 RepID=A0A212F8H7_DANPL|nr:hypothetical protein KGM_213392 [Danaus plexippus plexippus]
MEGDGRRGGARESEMEEMGGRQRLMDGPVECEGSRAWRTEELDKEAKQQLCRLLMEETQKVETLTMKVILEKTDTNTGGPRRRSLERVARATVVLKSIPCGLIVMGPLPVRRGVPVPGSPSTSCSWG